MGEGIKSAGVILHTVSVWRIRKGRCNDFFGLNKYGAVKNVVSNLLDNGSASKTTHGETKSAVAAGTVTITDAEAQKAKTGLTPEESIARLRRNTEGTQTAAAQIDLGKIERQAQDERAMKKAAMDASFKKTDAIYESYVNKKAELYEVATGKDGKAIMNDEGQVLMRRLTDAEIYELKASGKLKETQVFTNGINNDENAAAVKAALKSKNVDGPVYFVYNPYTGNIVSEIGAAVYSKVFEGDFFGLSNATKKIKEIENIYGEKGLYLYGHSRGTSTINNSMESQIRDHGGNPDAMKKVLKGAEITYYGAAANAQNGADLYEKLGGKDGGFHMEINAYDPVAGLPFIGDNPGTYAENRGYNSLAEAIKAIWGGDVSSHSCYGRAGNGCVEKYGIPTMETVHSRRVNKIWEEKLRNEALRNKGPRK